MAELLLIIVGALAYARGLVALRRSPAGRRTVGSRRIVAFALGLIGTAVAVSPPLHDLAHQALSAHMLQHVLLTLVAAPLIAAGAPQVVISRASPDLARRLLAPARRRLPRVRAPDRFPVLLVTAAGAHVTALWLWHAPALYEAALASAAVHVLEHAALFGTALLFWGSLLRPGRRARIASGVGVVCIGVLAAQGAVLAALIVFAGEPLYPSYGTGVFGLSVLEDQQLAGLVMWVPGGLVYGIAGAATFLSWFRAVEEPPGAADETVRSPIVRAPDAMDQMAGPGAHPPERRRRMRSGVVGWIALIGVATSLALLSSRTEAASYEDEIHRGGELFAAYCAACHGAHGEGGPGPGVLEGPPVNDIDVAYADLTIRTGRMPILSRRAGIIRDPDLDDQDRAEIVAWMAESFELDGEVPVVPRGDAARGRILFNEHCAACHSTTGKGGVAGGGMTILPVRDLDRVAIVSASRVGPFGMPRFSEAMLSDGDLADIATAIDEMDLERPSPLAITDVTHVAGTVYAAVSVLVLLGIVALIARPPRIVVAEEEAFDIDAQGPP